MFFEKYSEVSVNRTKGKNKKKRGGMSQPESFGCLFCFFSVFSVCSVVSVFSFFSVFLFNCTKSFSGRSWGGAHPSRRGIQHLGSFKLEV